jgi:hypothetical protein
MSKSIYDLKLGDSAFIGPIEVFRVPGGWLALTHQGPCFIPFNQEFNEKYFVKYGESLKLRGDLNEK